MSSQSACNIYLKEQFIKCRLPCRRCVNDERREKRTTVYDHFAASKAFFNARIADITFLCDTTIHIFGINTTDAFHLMIQIDTDHHSSIFFYIQWITKTKRHLCRFVLPNGKHSNIHSYLYSVFFGKKKCAYIKLAVKKTLLTYNLHSKKFQESDGSSIESLSVISCRMKRKFHKTRRFGSRIQNVTDKKCCVPCHVVQFHSATIRDKNPRWERKEQKAYRNSLLFRYLPVHKFEITGADFQKCHSSADAS